MIRIVADTTCDYPQELHIEEKITIIPLKVTINGMNYDDLRRFAPTAIRCCALPVLPS